MPALEEVPIQYHSIFEKLSVLRKPIVCSDSIYVRVRDVNAQFFRAYSYQPGTWIEWRVEDAQASLPALILAGGRNYLYLGRHALGSTLIIVLVLVAAFFVPLIVQVFLETWYTK